MAWHYYKSGKQLGPISAQSLRVLIDSGDVTLNDQVFGPGMVKWANASEVIDLIKPETPSDEQIIIERATQVLVSTSPTIAGHEVIQCLDIVSGECVFGVNILKEMIAGLTDVFGGRSETLQTVLRDARKACLTDLKTEAARIGANAVISVRLDYSEISGGGKSMLLLAASGTAVIVALENKN